MRLPFNNLISFMLPKTVFILLKINFHAVMLSEVTLYITGILYVNGTKCMHFTLKMDTNVCDGFISVN